MLLLWLDAQLPPSLGAWIAGRFGCECRHVNALQLRHAADVHIARAAALANAVVMTKDADFTALASAAGQTRVIWLRAGNMTNARLRTYLEETLPAALDAIERGAILVEV